MIRGVISLLCANTCIHEIAWCHVQFVQLSIGVRFFLSANSSLNAFVQATCIPLSIVCYCVIAKLDSINGAVFL